MAPPRSYVQSSIPLRSPLPIQPQTQCGWWKLPPDIQSRVLLCKHPASLWPWSHSCKTATILTVTHVKQGRLRCQQQYNNLFLKEPMWCGLSQRSSEWLVLFLPFFFFQFCYCFPSDIFVFLLLPYITMSPFYLFIVFVCSKLYLYTHIALHFHGYDSD